MVPGGGGILIGLVMGGKVRKERVETREKASKKKERVRGERCLGRCGHEKGHLTILGKKRQNVSLPTDCTGFKFT